MSDVSISSQERQYAECAGRCISEVLPEHCVQDWSETSRSDLKASRRRCRLGMQAHFLAMWT